MVEEIEFFRGMDVIEIRGGSHHTIALVRTKEGNKIYSFGKNDDGQLGIEQ